MRLLPSGERAVLVELAGIEEVLALAEPVRDLPGVEDVVPGERTLLVTVAAPEELAGVRQAVAGIAGFGGLEGVRAPVSGGTRVETARTGAGRLSAAQGTLEIGVVYDGPDLEDVASHTGLS
ncbi:MAG TPA: carboxyltransferase domain-containing protein, partial [Propionibacteriaceae bacterium]|nr:carboxyltransferase domain-containing protein [Propionibacteriaceae bacterium]